MYVFPTEVIKKVHDEVHSAWPNAPVIPHRPPRRPLRALLRPLRAVRRHARSRPVTDACHPTPCLTDIAS
jgi:hypothetical protein